MQTRAVVFRSDELTLEGQIIIPEQPRAALVLCHGIPSGGPPDPDDEGYAGFARAMAQAGYAATWFNFRGCRGAPGEFSMPGWCADIAGVLDEIAKLPGIADLPRILVGSSAGGSASIDVATNRPDVSMVATLAAPSSLARANDDRKVLIQRLRNIGIIHDPAYPQNIEAWWSDLLEASPVNWVDKIAPRPLLLVHGDADPVVPYHHAEALFDKAGEPKELVRIPHASHQLRRDPRALDALTDWLDRRLARRPVGP